MNESYSAMVERLMKKHYTEFNQELERRMYEPPDFLRHIQAEERLKMDSDIRQIYTELKRARNGLWDTFLAGRIIICPSMGLLDANLDKLDAYIAKQEEMPNMNETNTELAEIVKRIGQLERNQETFSGLHNNLCTRMQGIEGDLIS